MEGESTNALVTTHVFNPGAELVRSLESDGEAAQTQLAALLVIWIRDAAETERILSGSNAQFLNATEALALSSASDLTIVAVASYPTAATCVLHTGGHLLLSAGYYFLVFRVVGWLSCRWGCTACNPNHCLQTVYRYVPVPVNQPCPDSFACHPLSCETKLTSRKTLQEEMLMLQHCSHDIYEVLSFPAAIISFISLVRSNKVITKPTVVPAGKTTEKTLITSFFKTSSLSNFLSQIRRNE